jgi:hypothetical protein
VFSIENTQIGTLREQKLNSFDMPLQRSVVKRSGPTRFCAVHWKTGCDARGDSHPPTCASRFGKQNGIVGRQRANCLCRRETPSCADITSPARGEELIDRRQRLRRCTRALEQLRYRIEATPSREKP